MFPLENEYKSLLPRNAHWTYKAACTIYRGRLDFVKMYNNFLQVVVLLKKCSSVDILCSNGIFWNEKKKKKKDKQTKSVFSREVKSRRIHCTIAR